VWGGYFFHLLTEPHFKLYTADGINNIISRWKKMKIIKAEMLFKKDFGRYKNELIADNSISPLALRIILILTNCNTSGKNPYTPSIKSLAKQLNESESNIDRAVKELKSQGYLESQGKKENTVWKVTQTPEKKEQK
jgi:DNA-binding MarR family transcriptional regulator